jgi:hypothetical protein
MREMDVCDKSIAFAIERGARERVRRPLQRLSSKPRRSASANRNYQELAPDGPELEAAEAVMSGLQSQLPGAGGCGARSGQGAGGRRTSVPRGSGRLVAGA